jgi:hypothetical protein
LIDPFTPGEWLASRLPWARADLAHDKGHLLVVIDAIDQMLEELVDLVG